MDDRVTVNPIHRPRKITAIHKVRDTTAAAFAAAGVDDDGAPQRWAARPVVSSKIPMFTAASSRTAIFAWKTEL